MSKVLTDNANYSAIADAIRDKGVEGTWKPSEMAEAIEKIETGVTPTGEIDITENGTYDVTDKASAVVNVPDSIKVTSKGFAYTEGTFNPLELGVTSISVTNQYLGITNVDTVIVPSGVSNGGGVNWFYTTSVKNATMNIICTGCFSACRKLETLTTTAGVTSLGENVIRECSSIKTVDLLAVTSIGQYNFYPNLGKLTDIYLRSTTICTLNTGNTSIPSTAVIHVPADLLEDYKVATNWATYAEQFTGDL